VNSPVQMTGGEAIVRQVLANGIDTVFGLPGAQMYPLFDGLYRLSNDIRTITPRHEQTTAYMAYGAALSTGRPAAFSVVPGPGVLNTTAAISTAWANNAPIICLTGQVPSAFLGKRRGHLHEIPDQLSTIRTLTKWAERIDRIEDAPRLVNEAFRQMLSGRQGPVSVEMCWDTMAKQAPVTIEGPARPIDNPEPDPDAVARAARLIAGARTVMIVLGGGAQHAGAEVEALARRLDACVTAFRAGRGIIAEDDGLFLFSAAAQRLWAETDVVIAIGTRAEMPYMRWTGMRELIDRPQAPPHLIRIDIDPAEMDRLVPHVGIVADSADGARALLAAVDREGADTSWGDRVATVRAEATRDIRKVQPSVDYLDVIRAVLPRDGFFVEELCQAGYASYFAFPAYAPRTYVSSGFQGTLGYGFPTALGVKAANPGKAVVSIAGDGGFMFAMPELATAVQYGLGVVTVLFNNASFLNIRRDQQTRFGGRVLGADLVNPDFQMLAESFGVAHARVSSPAELKPALAKAIDADAPALIEVMVERDSEVSPWDYIHFAPPR
jgi:acetolactate synthase I/II/III large subunit